MPGFDRSGPMGAGPMTGGRRGLCNPAYAGYDSRFDGMFGFDRGLGFGRGFRGGFGRGMGRAFGRRFWNQPSYYPAYAQTPEEELNMLKAEANAVKNSLDTINRRIAELEKSSE
ncbi:MAG: DUF5320 domain-containing protein [Deltaproteobacteria bacterium]|nr:DUF5320 domain-containing protein [Deltaproteobacteria bacterium]